MSAKSSELRETKASGADWTRFIKEVGRGAHGARDLPEAEAEQLFAAMLAGKVDELELGALWISYRIKGEALPELLGFCRAAAAASLRLECSAGVLPVVLPSYNGARRLPNLTPLLAHLLVREGVPVLVHGLATSYGRVTSAEIFQGMGIGPCADAAEAMRRLDQCEPVWMPLEQLSPGVARLMSLRSRIGVRSSVHTVSKLLDPFAGQSLRVVPVTHPDYLRRMSECLCAQGTPALLMRGTEGEPYASPRRMPALIGFRNGVQAELVPQGEHEVEEAGLPAQIDAAATLAWMKEVLAGSAPVPATLKRQVACLSAAASAPR